MPEMVYGSLMKSQVHVGIFIREMTFNVSADVHYVSGRPSSEATSEATVGTTK